jgi:hypothetical protein
MVLKAINDIQPEVGLIKNMVTVQSLKSSKPAEALHPKQNRWHTNERDTKSDKKMRFSGAAVLKGTRLRYSTAPVTTTQRLYDTLTIIML